MGTLEQGGSEFISPFWRFRNVLIQFEDIPTIEI
jgi:hypothetical protein